MYKKKTRKEKGKHWKKQLDKQKDEPRENNIDKISGSLLESTVFVLFYGWMTCSSIEID